MMPMTIAAISSPSMVRWSFPGGRSPNVPTPRIASSMHDRPVVLTCAISGALANRDQCPAIPYTPEEYAAEARRIVDEGGVHIHIHARRPDGTPSYAVEDFDAIASAIRAEAGDAALI